MRAIGWDIVTMLLPFIGRKATHGKAIKVLDIVITKGNAKEVFLKCIEGLKNIIWERNYDEDEEDDDGEATLAEKISEFRMDDNDENDDKVDPVVQTAELCQAINTGYSFILYNSWLKGSFQTYSNRSSCTIFNDFRSCIINESHNGI